MMSSSHLRLRPRALRAALVTAALAAIVLLAVFAVANRSGVGAATAATLSPPVIHEAFRALPCPTPKNPATTLEMLGCAQQDVLRTDAKIDAAGKAIFARLQDHAARRRFIKAQKAWFTYRKADCASVADKFEGGSLAGVTKIDCAVERNVQHLKEIRAFLRVLRREG